MKLAATPRSGFTEEKGHDCPTPPDKRHGSHRRLWVLVLTLPTLIIALVIGLEIFGLLVRLFSV
ncbi:hypothetical protein PWR63_00400 [Paraburkholderia sp. A2WS-5]|uniref:hypothetical protein n=1 Tax=unclassified Paraburkholderia TaxID=2615204 RepID=UPI003B78BAA0